MFFGGSFTTARPSRFRKIATSLYAGEIPQCYYGFSGGDRMTMPTTILARLRAILAGSIGNLVEWYDWYTYSAAALYFAPVFFPKGDQTAQLLQAAAVFAVGFFARPVGAWLLGRYADRVGRKAALK